MWVAALCRKESWKPGFVPKVLPLVRWQVLNVAIYSFSDSLSRIWFCHDLGRANVYSASSQLGRGKTDGLTVASNGQALTSERIHTQIQRLRTCGDNWWRGVT